MIDRSASDPPGGPPPRPSSDLFTDLFHGARPDAAAPAVPPLSPAAAAPRAPQNVQESGLSLLTLCNLILKHLYLTGHLLGAHVARELRLPFAVVDEALKLLKEERCIEVGSGDLLGPASYRFNLTEQGRVRAREAFEQSRYVGPAPVALADYQAQCRRQTITGMSCSSDSLRDAFSHLIIRPSLLEEVGPAVCSGRSIFVYGPPGNGKTVIAKGLGQLLNRHGGEIFVPYALFAENSIVTLFDPTIHQTTDNADASAPAAADAERTAGHLQRLWDENAPDLRWRRVRRPVVITGGELTLDMLDLRYNRESNYYTAPMHIKANGGVFLIDDFGRQIVSPRDLLNRWILPLEERIDYLTLATGKKFAVPFEQLIIFSTNLDPRELVDEAFLRRIRHKIAVGPPNRDLYTRIFETCCRERQIAFSPEAVAFLYETYYINGKDPRSSDPRDLLEIVQAICRYRNQSVHLTADLMAEAGRRFFCQI